MFGWFGHKDKEVEFNFSNIGVDMHSHILPGIDDGAQNLQQSLILANKFIELGYNKLIATPHIMADYYRNTPEKIYKALDILKDGLSKNNIALTVEAAAEYYVDEAFEKKLSRKELMTFGTNFVLFELSFVNPPQNLIDLLYRIQAAGYVPVLAHPERYPYYGSIENYLQIRDAGCNLQINTISLTGYYGASARQLAEQLTDHHAVDFIGSDMHHPKHAAALKSSLQLPRVQKLLAEELQNTVLR